MAKYAKERFRVAHHVFILFHFDYLTILLFLLYVTD